MANKHAVQRVVDALEQLGIGYKAGEMPPSRVEDSASLANLAKCSVKTATNSLTYLRQAGGDVGKAIQIVRDIQNKQYAATNIGDIDIKPEKVTPTKDESAGIPLRTIRPKQR